MRKCYFSTITVNKWISIFQDYPEANEIIVESLDYLNKNGWATIYAFIIMRDHLHIAWSMNGDRTVDEVVNSFKKFTGSRIVSLLKNLDLEYLEFYFISDRKDRQFKFWKLNANNFKIQHIDILREKIYYLHYNPLKGNYRVCEKPEDYIFSSAMSYKQNTPIFEFLTLV